MNIGVDIDGVLTDIKDFELRYGEPFFKKHYNKGIVNMDAFSIKDIFNCNSFEEFTFWLSYVKKYALYEKARESMSDVLDFYKKDGDNIYIITSRMFTDKNNIFGMMMRKMVKSWLSDNDITYDDIVFINNKIPAIKEYNIDVMIEDDVNNIKMLRDYTNIICFDNDYNRCINYNDVDRVSNAMELQKSLRRFK